MKFHNSDAELFVPDGKSAEEALKRTTHLGVGAHPDDLEIMGFHGILHCMRVPGRWFTGITCSDGAGSPRAGRYANMNDDEMKQVRCAEQKNAASMGRYSAVAQLKHPSSTVKDPEDTALADDLKTILAAAHPEVVYTHNPADKHDAHVAVSVKLIGVLRELPRESRPKKVYGAEIWRDLDWMPDDNKVVLDVSGGAELAARLLAVFDSQIAGGKRYDLATLGRWRANATYLQSHAVDTAQETIVAIDLTPLIEDGTPDIVGYVLGFVDKFREDVRERIAKRTRRATGRN